MKIKNWLTCVQDRAKWMSLRRPKPSIERGSAPEEEEEEEEEVGFITRMQNKVFNLV